MSDLDANRLRRELLLEQAIDLQIDSLVKQANQTAAKLKDYPRMEESQMRNLLNASIESRSVEVVINFIRYQIARNGSAWGTPIDSFGHTVIKDLRTSLEKWTDKVVTFIGQKSGDEEATDNLREQARVRLMQLYLGYLNRAFYYGKKTGEFSRLVEVANGS